MTSHHHSPAHRRFVQTGLLRRNGADPAALDHFRAGLVDREVDPPIAR